VRQIRILILEILQCIPVVKILIFLDLAKPGTRPNGVGLSAAWLPKKTISFLGGHYLIFIFF
jgi:hypothetical protein